MSRRMGNVRGVLTIVPTASTTSILITDPRAHSTTPSLMRTSRAGGSKSRTTSRPTIAPWGRCWKKLRRARNQSQTRWFNIGSRYSATPRSGVQAGYGTQSTDSWDIPETDPERKVRIRNVEAAPEPAGPGDGEQRAHAANSSPNISGGEGHRPPGRFHRQAQGDDGGARQQAKHTIY